MKGRSRTTKLTMFRCKICGRIFHHGNKTSYCTKCVPDGGGWGGALMYAEVIAKRNNRKTEQK